MSKHYKGQERITLRKEVESQRDSGHSFITIASTLGISPINILDSALTKCWGSECKSGDAMLMINEVQKYVRMVSRQ